MYKCIHFNIKELVSPQVYNRFGEDAWMFFDDGVLRDLDEIREANCGSIIINNWHTGGCCKESGLRDNMTDIMKSKKSLYCSAHSMGKGFDLKDGLGRNSRLFSIVCSLIQKKKVKHFLRVENIKNTNTWVHIDSFQTKNNGLVVF